MLYGRGGEQERVARLVDSARSGTGGALLISGEPGVGKSCLLETAVTAAEAGGDLTVLRTSGIESEAPLAFAALQRLLSPLTPLIGHIPAPQAHALRVAFGEVSTADSTDRFLVFLGALSLLAEAAETRPVFASVDDAHWLDDASAAALLFIARRLQMERIAMVFAARVGDVRSFEAPDIPAVSLTGLDLAAATHLLRNQSGLAVSNEVAAHLLTATGGNPLALVELPRVLSTGQLAGTQALPSRVPVTAAVERVFLDRVRRLSAPAQCLLLTAAADDSTRTATITSAADSLGAGADALAEAEGAGLVTVTDGTLRLQHPLLRSAVYAGATSVERRQAHAALAAVLTRAADADRRTWHLASAAEEPDATVVAELEAVAARAEQRGGFEAASAAWERAAELTASSTDPAERLFNAAQCAWLAGRPGRARALVEDARRGTRDPRLVADIVRLQARIEWNTGSVPLAHRLLLTGARDVAEFDAARAREMAMLATSIVTFGGSSGVDIDPAEFAGLPDPDAEPGEQSTSGELSGSGLTPRQQLVAELLLGFDHVPRGELVAAAEMFRRAIRTAGQLELTDQDLLANLAIGVTIFGDLAACGEYHEQLLTLARNTGAQVMVLYALTRLAFADLPRGDWGNMIARQSEALQIGESTGQPVLAAMPSAWLLLLAAHRGEESYERQLHDLEAVLDTAGTGTLGRVLRDVVSWAKAVHASPRSATGFHHLAQVEMHVIKHAAAIDRFESAVHAGQRETAQLWIDMFEGYAQAADQDWLLAAVAHGRAVLAADAGDTDAADNFFQQALALQSASRPALPYDTARTRLAYGEHLRRTRRRVAAREHLRAALDIFEDLKARPWAERAAQELRASGETARRRDETSEAELTPQEHQVAQLVRQGLSNREVAAKLFVSPRTVDFHLRNVFTKTGVVSRAELSHLALG